MNYPNRNSNNNFDEHDYGVDGSGDHTKVNSDDKLESEKYQTAVVMKMMSIFCVFFYNLVESKLSITFRGINLIQNC
eukprot:1000430-Ditylum_brightwellii.AAC.1